MSKLTIACVFVLFGAVVSQTDKELWEAAKEGNLDYVILALAEGANPNWRYPKGERGWTALHAASANNHPAVVSALLEGGADIDMKDTNHGMAALHWSAITNYPAVAKVLLEAGADKDILADEGMTPLYAAAEEGSINVVKELIAHGADVNLTNGPGWFMEMTPLMGAATKGHFDIVKTLINANAYVKYSNSRGSTALDMAYESDQQEIIKFLLQSESRTLSNVDPIKIFHILANLLDRYSSSILKMIYQLFVESVALFSE